MKKQRKTDLYAADIATGMTVAEVAEKYGVSRSAVYACVPIKCHKYFKPFTKDDCVYTNLRKWLNDNKVTKKEFIRRMNRTVGGDVYANMTDWFKGRAYPSKKVIDAILEVTGLTYEQLWYRGEESNAVADSCNPIIINADRLRAMTAEEFARFLLYTDQQNLTVDVCDNAYCDVFDNDNHHAEKCSEDGCIAAIVKWLHSEDSIKTDKAGNIIHA